jgi:cGMP-dependent protein kinase
LPTTEDFIDLKSSPRDLSTSRKRQKFASPSSPIKLPEEHEALNARISQPVKSDASKRLIKEALRRHIVFSSLTDDNSEVIMSAMKLYRIKSREVVFEQGMEGYNFYVVAAGQLEVLVNRLKVKTLKTGDSFGELALLQNLPRSATVKTIEPCQLWVIDRYTFNEALRLVNSATYTENKTFIDGVVMLQYLTQIQRNSLVSCLTTQTYSHGDVIVNEGDAGELFFIIKEGTVACSQQGQEIRLLSRGEFFGEQALLYNCARTATCKAVGPVKCLSITRTKLNEALGVSLQKIIYRNSLRIALRNSDALNKLHPDQHDQIIDRMEVIAYAKDAVVVKEGTKMGNKLWVVVKGSLAYKGNSDAFAGLYVALGDNEILMSEKGRFTASVVANEASLIAEIPKAEIERALGTSLYTAAVSNSMVGILKKAEIFQSLSTENLQLLSTYMTQRSYQDLEVIFEQGSYDTNFYVIKEGTVDIVKDGVRVQSVTKLDYFGEKSILSIAPRSASVVARNHVTCWVLSKESFHRVVSQKVVAHLASRLNQKDEGITLDQLVPVQVIGKGSLAIVTLVARKDRAGLYALKSVPRWKVVSFDMFENVAHEKRVLELLNHVFILKSIKTLKDRHRIYYLTEFIKGVNFFDALHKIGLCTDEKAKFYAASLVVILEHLHERSIVYRDLKPENLLLDDSGFFKLIDFGTAKIIAGRTYTILGTPHYMAPEVILGNGYDCLADYWMLGVMLYELICGLLPFGDDLKNPYDIYEAILRAEFMYPRYIRRPFASQTFIEQLLSKHPAARVGVSLDKLKSHKWFKDFNWNQLVNREMTPPFIPVAPNYAAKVREALQTQSSVHDFLTFEERSEDRTSINRRAEPPDWDSEF